MTKQKKLKKHPSEMKIRKIKNRVQKIIRGGIGKMHEKPYEMELQDIVIKEKNSLITRDYGDNEYFLTIYNKDVDGHQI